MILDPLNIYGSTIASISKTEKTFLPPPLHPPLFKTNREGQLPLLSLFRHTRLGCIDTLFLYLCQERIWRRGALGSNALRKSGNTVKRENIKQRCYSPPKEIPTANYYCSKRTILYFYSINHTLPSSCC